jgi:cell division septal protein FtsQ
VLSPAKDSLLANGRFALNVLLLGLLGWALTWLFISDQFYVSQIRVEGNRRVSTEAIQEASGVLGYSIFWVNPRQVAATVAQLLPPVRRVEVRSGLPNQVTLTVEEQGEQVMWQVAGKRYWVDDDGYLHPVSGESEPSLLVNDIRPGLPTQVDVSALSAAMQIIRLLPELRTIEYAPLTGLRFTHPRGWLVYLGTGNDMERKVSVLRAMEVQFSGQEREQPVLIDLRFPDSPYYRVGAGAGEN